MIFSAPNVVNKPAVLILAAAPLETDQVPPGIRCVYCEVAFPQMVDEPLISIVETLFTKLDAVPVLAKLVKLPFEALFTAFITVFIEALFPPAIPWLKS